MKKIGALGALLAVGLLAGCASSGEESPELSATVTVTATPTPTPSPTFSNGLALQQLANIDLNCEQDFEVDPGVFAYYAECNDNVLIEFGPNVDLAKHPKIATDAYGKVSYDPWLISDKWMIKSKEKNLLPIMEEYPEAELFIPEDGERPSSVKLEEFMSAVESVSGNECTEDKPADGKALRSATCLKDNGDIYMNVFIFQTFAERNDLLSAMAAPFVYNNRNAYSVQGAPSISTPILNKAEAKAIAKKVEWSDVLNMNDTDLLDE